MGLTCSVGNKNAICPSLEIPNAPTTNLDIPELPTKPPYSRGASCGFVELFVGFFEQVQDVAGGVVVAGEDVFDANPAGVAGFGGGVDGGGGREVDAGGVDGASAFDVVVVREGCDQVDVDA